MSQAFDSAAETERVRRNQDRNAPRYDRQIPFFARLLQRELAWRDEQEARSGSWAGSRLDR
jgi:hypothetical protein